MEDPRHKAILDLIAARSQGEQEPVEMGVLTQADVERSAGQPQQSRFEQLMNILDTPGRITRAGLSSLQTDGDVLRSIGDQVGVGDTEAPSGFDIASRLGDDYGIDNPYALTAIATAADVLDPSMFIPGVGLAKAGIKGVQAAPKAAKAAKGMYKAGDISFPATNTAQAKQIADALKQQGKLKGTTTLVKDTEPVQKLSGGVKFLDDAIRPATNLDTKKFEGVRDLFKSKSQLK